MYLKQLFAKQVPVTEWPRAKALPSTPLLLNGFGMWEKLVTLGLPIVQCLSRLKCEHSRAKAEQPPSSELGFQQDVFSLEGGVERDRSSFYPSTLCKLQSSYKAYRIKTTSDEIDPLESGDLPYPIICGLAPGGWDGEGV